MQVTTTTLHVFAFLGVCGGLASVYYPRVILTHGGRTTYTYVGNRTIIGSGNGLSPGRCRAIVWTNAGIWLIAPSGTNFSEILIDIHTFSLKKMHLKMSSVKWRPSCLGLNVLAMFLVHICQWIILKFVCYWKDKSRLTFSSHKSHKYEIVYLEIQCFWHISNFLKKIVETTEYPRSVTRYIFTKGMNLSYDCLTLLLKMCITIFLISANDFLGFNLSMWHLKMSSANWRPFCLDLNVLTIVPVRWNIVNQLSVKSIIFLEWASSPSPKDIAYICKID